MILSKSISPEKQFHCLFSPNGRPTDCLFPPHVFAFFPETRGSPDRDHRLVRWCGCLWFATGLLREAQCADSNMNEDSSSRTSGFLWKDVASVAGAVDR